MDYAMDKDLDYSGKTILVTGSGRNLGKAIILEFAARGANVVINTRSNRDDAQGVLEEAQKLGAKGIVVLGNAGEKETVAAFKREAEAAFGRVDIYVSNAARRMHVEFWETTDEQWHAHLNQQLTGAWYLAKAFAPTMRDAGYGRILHMNGPDGLIGGWDRVPHSTAKGGLRTLTKSLAIGLSQYGITVNDIDPGVADTERDVSTHPGGQARARENAKSIPIRRNTKLSEVAFACAFLCSPRAQAITGSVIHLDGGRWMFG
jgi:3-oxoacyl-[acyl-carrier protein] reductase